MRVRRLILGMLDTNCWLVDDGAGTPVLVVDPGDAPEAVLAQVGDAPAAAVALTHGHFDHIGAVRGLVESTGAPLLVHEADAESMLTPEGAGGAVFGMPF
ncbi:MAG TPA: MBL fold metallo-hydrolase, partial [Coriobacteriia bacterium]|nr:MBL fold metallo-hydrolase [Coriobacteriia bacterium]